MSYCADKLVNDRHTHTRTHWHTRRDAGNDNTRRPKLVSYNKSQRILAASPISCLPSIAICEKTLNINAYNQISKRDWLQNSANEDAQLKGWIAWQVYGFSFHFPMWSTVWRIDPPHLLHNYELSNLRALRISMLFKIISFNVRVGYYVWKFKVSLWNSTPNILPVHWKLWILFTYKSLRALRFKSSVFLKRTLLSYLRCHLPGKTNQLLQNK